MKAVLLCAGYGTRLYPLTKNQPKPLLPVGGRPILDYLLEKVEEIPGVDQVYVVTNDKFFPHFKQWAKERSKAHLAIEAVNDGTQSEEERLGAIGDLFFLIQKFQLREEVAVFAGDNFFDFSLKDFARFAVSHRPHVSLGVVDLKEIRLASQYGIVRVDGEGRVLEFIEKPKEPPSTLASTGIYWIPKESIDFLDRYIQEGHNADRLGDHMAWLLKVDRLYAYRFEGDWLDIGDLDSYRKADCLLS